VTNSPQQFGDYHLLEKIATGGMAEVWRARAYGMAGFEKILVIKKVLTSLSSNREFIELFIDEARIAVQLHHANIVQVFDLGEVNGTYFMAMEFVQGPDLSVLLRLARDEGPVGIPVALLVITEVLKALEFAHGRCGEDGKPLRIVHCDISPHNILVSQAGEVKITDFGISRAAFQAEATHEVVRGKFAYMSPEQVDGHELDGRSDLYSLGIVLFEMLTGQRLFKADTREGVLGKVTRGEIPSPRAIRADISAELEGVLLKMLQRKPKHRYSSAAEVLGEISALMVREGHRVTNRDLAAFVNDILQSPEGATASMSKKRPASEPCGVVALALQAFSPPKTLSSPKLPMDTLLQEWSVLLRQAGGEIWEHEGGSMLVCWLGGDQDEHINTAAQAGLALQRHCQERGYYLSAGLAPGVAQIHTDSQRPPDGWELAGPFYLARWMMNLSAHRGRILMTEVSARKTKELKIRLLGQISILGNRYINLYEAGA
jgi:serine/threonine protein kinase